MRKLRNYKERGGFWRRKRHRESQRVAHEPPPELTRNSSVFRVFLRVSFTEFNDSWTLFKENFTPFLLELNSPGNSHEKNPEKPTWKIICSVFALKRFSLLYFQDVLFSNWILNHDNHDKIKIWIIIFPRWKIVLKMRKRRKDIPKRNPYHSKGSSTIYSSRPMEGSSTASSV